MALHRHYPIILINKMKAKLYRYNYNMTIFTQKWRVNEWFGPTRVCCRVRRPEKSQEPVHVKRGREWMTGLAKTTPLIIRPRSNESWQRMRLTRSRQTHALLLRSDSRTLSSTFIQTDWRRAIFSTCILEMLSSRPGDSFVYTSWICTPFNEFEIKLILTRLENVDVCGKFTYHPPQKLHCRVQSWLSYFYFDPMES